MRIWTTQTVEFWNQMQEYDISFCNAAKSWGSGDSKEAYDWMSKQMVASIGPLPRSEIVLPA